MNFSNIDDVVKYLKSSSEAATASTSTTEQSQVEIAHEQLFAPLAIAYSICSFYGNILKQQQQKMISVCVCGCRGLDEICDYNILSPLLSIPPDLISVILMGDELEEQETTTNSSSFKPISKIKRFPHSQMNPSSLKECCGDANSFPDFIIVLQPGLQLHRSWIQSFKEVLSTTTASKIICSSLDPREYRNDKWVLESHGITVSQPTVNPFAPKNATIPGMQRDISKWSSLLWVPSITDRHMQNEKLIKMVDFILEKQTEGIWCGFWDCYQFGNLINPNSESQSQQQPMICLGDDHWLLPNEGKILFSNRRTKGEFLTIIRGLKVLEQDISLLNTKCTNEIEKAYWCCCIRHCYLEPIYKHFCGGDFITSYDSIDEAAAFAFSQGMSEINDSYLIGIMQRDFDSLLGNGGKLSSGGTSIMNISNSQTEIRFKIKGGRHLGNHMFYIKGDRKPFSLLL